MYNKLAIKGNLKKAIKELFFVKHCKSSK